MDLTIVRLVLNTLDEIEVKGKKNVDAMLGCMNALETFIQKTEIESKSEEADNG